MFVYPEVSEAATASVTFQSNGESYTFRNPETRSTKSTVRVHDGETIVLGGLILNQKATIITKLPVLGDIPLLGALFRHKEQSPGRERELLVFITPHIMKNGKAASPAPVKKAALPLREQAKVIPLTRQQSVSAYLNNFEAKR
jgi:type II secretory pathway component GspD/PulD (secretin)